MPGQCLPKANAATVHRCLQRWSVWSAHGGCSDFLGGSKLEEALKRIDLVIILCVSDAHPSNDCINALEESRLLQGLSSLGDEQQIIARLPALCVQHQASLAKRPALLSIPGLCSGLVRMCAWAAYRSI